MVEDGPTIQYVSCVADAIVGVLEGDDAELPWEMAIVNQPDVNAHVLPGGKIVVKAGILSVANNQHQLAAVLGHEVAHVTAHHANERASRQYGDRCGRRSCRADTRRRLLQPDARAYEALSAGAALGVMNPFSRKQETEADVVGLEYMARAGFDPRESVELWKNMNARQDNKIPGIHVDASVRRYAYRESRGAVSARTEAVQRGSGTGQKPQLHALNWLA
jgi:predicted Zn-dependent protease